MKKFWSVGRVRHGRPSPWIPFKLILDFEFLHQRDIFKESLKSAKDSRVSFFIVHIINYVWFNSFKPDITTHVNKIGSGCSFRK